ncbi:hypothetical protein LPJ59_004084, partial [Coemansia sp. RSA 2399]
FKMICGSEYNAIQFANVLFDANSAVVKRTLFHPDEVTIEMLEGHCEMFQEYQGHRSLTEQAPDQMHNETAHRSDDEKCI